MKINPVERYYTKLGRQEGIKEGRQEGIKEGRQKGIKEGRQKGKYGFGLEIAEKMLKDNFPIEKISELTGLSKKEILKVNNSSKPN